MSEFVVYRTLGNGRCLVLDGTRIAGGKPDYRGNNYVTSWVTNETYGPVDELKAENAKLREELQERTTHAVIVSDKSTDCATGHCECELCRRPIDPWDRYCRHCGAEVRPYDGSMGDG